MYSVAHKKRNCKEDPILLKFDDAKIKINLVDHCLTEWMWQRKNMF